MNTCKLLRKGAAKASTWAGGTTTELFIYPETADYKARDFEVRLSSATVDLESSDFTALPGFTRHIMPLEGGMRLVHEAHHERELAPYETDTFSGGCNTKSYGKCVDFNLMCAQNWNGSLTTLWTPQQALCAANGISAIYARSDGVAVTVTQSGSQIFADVLNTGDFLAIISRADTKSGSAQLNITVETSDGARPLAVLAVAESI